MLESRFVVDVANIVLTKVGLSNSSEPDFALLDNLIRALRVRAQFPNIKIFLVIADSRLRSNQWHSELLKMEWCNEVEWVRVRSQPNVENGENVDQYIFQCAMQFVCKQFKGEISVVTGDHFRDIFKGGATSPAMRVFDEIQRGSDDKIYCSNSQLTAVFEDMILTPTFDSEKNPLFNPQGPSDLLNRYFAAKYATHKPEVRGNRPGPIINIMCSEPAWDKLEPNTL